MKQAPNFWTIKDLFSHANTVHKQTKDGRWVCARPIGFFSIWWRIKLAWLVFVGKCDALKWEEQ